MQRIAIRVSDDIARGLEDAATRHPTIEEVVVERIAHSGREVPAWIPDYAKLIELGSDAPSARKSIAEIDADIEASRNEW